MLRRILTICLVAVALKLNGQTTESFRYADSLTYSLFTEKRWDELITEGHRAVRNGYDYYYLRMRTGIAYYEKHNYGMSAIQFRKALTFSEKDQTALEYLFYSFYLSGRFSQAMALLQSFYPQNRERIIKESKIRKNSLTIESFVSDAKTEDILNVPASYLTNPEPGGQIITKYFVNNALYASHVLGNHFSYFHAFTNLIKENYLHYFDGTYQADLPDQRIIQNQYYGSLSYFTSTGWLISPSFHFLTASYPLIAISANGMNPTSRTYNVRSDGYFAGLAVTRSMGFAVASASSGYTSFNSVQRLSATFSLMFYPAGNTDFYFGGKISSARDIRNSSSNPGLTGGLTAGLSVARVIWFEFSGLSGSLNYYADDNGLYIYNSTDILRNKLTARIIVPYNRAGLTFFAGVGISSYSSYFIPTGTISSWSTNRINYSSNNYTGGVSWKF